MEAILQELGFKPLTGPLWQHKETKIIISISPDNVPSDLVKILIRMGEAECQAMIQVALGIKPKF